MYLLGLDVGTTGCKAILIDDSGDVKGFAYHEYSIETDSSGKAEQDAETVWLYVKEVIRRALNEKGRLREPSAVSVSVQGDAVIPVDEDGNALHPAILGMDYRSLDEAAECSAIFGGEELFKTTGMRPHPINTLTKIMLFRRIAPEVYDKATRFVTYSDFIMGKLGAPGFIDFTMAGRTMAFEIETGAWSLDILSRTGVPEEKLSRPIASGSVVGHMSKLLKRELGLGQDVTVIAGGHDQPCCAIGAGIIGQGKAVVSSGTAEVMSTAFDQPRLEKLMYDSYYPCYPYVLPGNYFTFALNHVGGLLLKWFREGFCCDESYIQLNELMPGEPTKLMVLPHLNGTGTPYCNMEAKGMIAGLSMSSTRYDIYRAMMEAQCYELRLNKNTLEKAGVEISGITAVGGGAKSEAWLQMKADILDCEISTLENGEAGCIGAAILAGKGYGIFETYETAVERVVRRSKSFYPSKPYVNIYNDKFQLYNELYQKTKDINGKF